MNLQSRSIVAITLALVLLASIALAAFVGVSLVGGGSNGSPLVSGPDSTPSDATPVPFSSPYPTHDPSLPTQPADDTNRTPGPLDKTPDVPPSVTISGVEIPIPKGSDYFYGRGPGTRLLHWVWKGGSSLQFDDYGLTYAEIQGTDENDFSATLDALWILSQAVATPSPLFVTIEGESIPLPAGSFYSTLDGPADLGNPLIYVVRLSHSVLMFDSHGLSYEVVKAGDRASFDATFAALNSFSQAD